MDNPKTVSFASGSRSGSFCDSSSNENNPVSASHQTSTPFVFPGKTKNDNDLDGSIFDHSDTKERSSLEISCIPSSSLNNTSREKSVSYSDSITLSEDVSSCATSCAMLDRGFVQSSIDSNNSCTSDKSGITIEEKDTKTIDNVACVEKVSERRSNDESYNNKCGERDNVISSDGNINNEVSEIEYCEIKSNEISKDEKTQLIESSEKDNAMNALISSKDSASRYLEDANKQIKSKVQNENTKKRKRLTMAEKRAMETLELFGGSLDTVLRKSESFGERLQKQKESFDIVSNSADEPEPKRSRLERAKAESSILFKDIPLGKQLEADRQKSTQRTDKISSTIPNEGRRMTRLERVKMETLQSFGGTSFDDLLGVAKKKPKENDDKITESHDSIDEINKENTTDDNVVV